jgi:hypothetical protein
MAMLKLSMSWVLKFPVFGGITPCRYNEDRSSRLFQNGRTPVFTTPYTSKPTVRIWNRASQILSPWLLCLHLYFGKK